jgi:hypothetical protein
VPKSLAPGVSSGVVWTCAEVREDRDGTTARLADRAALARRALVPAPRRPVGAVRAVLVSAPACRAPCAAPVSRPSRRAGRQGLPQVPAPRTVAAVRHTGDDAPRTGRIVDWLRAALSAAWPEPGHGPGPARQATIRRLMRGLLRGAPRAAAISAKRARWPGPSFDIRVSRSLGTRARAVKDLYPRDDPAGENGRVSGRVRDVSEVLADVAERRAQGGAGVRQLPRGAPPTARIRMEPRTFSAGFRA